MRFKIYILLGTVVFGTFIARPEDRSQARSMVITRYGIVASEHPLASQAASMILADGGNAIDAAIAANAAMGVLAPMMCGIGGDLFAIVYEAKTGKLHGLNASGWSPEKLTPEFLRAQGFDQMPQGGVHSITVPGVVDGWQMLRDRFGRKRLGQLLAPAIRYAEEGFPVTEWVSSYWHETEALLRKTPNAAATFLPEGRPPRVGEIFRNPDLAWSYRQIARHGRSAFYSGAIARRIVDFMERLDGTLTAEDLKAFRSEWVEPISTTYRGWEVYEIPPQGQGIAALVMLNIMEPFPIREYGAQSSEALHVMIEAKKLAYADMLRYVADERFGKVPVAEMLSKRYAKERARHIDLNRANCNVPHGTPFDGGTDTTYLCVVDKDGNIVSLIQSNYYGFGSGLVPDGTGFPLHNRGGLFSLDPAHPNVLAGRKRPLHTIIPGFMSKDGVRIAFGIMGGFNQAQAHAQFVSNIVDHGLNLQAALEAPRFTKLTFEGCDVQMESRIPEEVRRALAEKGHQINVLGPYAQPVGGGQAVARDFSAGVNYGASDPRKDGAAHPEPLPLR